MFSSESSTLYDFFIQTGVTYYIPFYQRQYSWDKDNVDKLLDDLSDGVRKIVDDKKYLRFIGSVILWGEQKSTKGVHCDTNGLITKMYNVIDGQQRISTLAILSIVLSEKLKYISDEVDFVLNSENEEAFSMLLNSINDRSNELQNFYSTEFNKTNIKPNKKPKIIRALDSHSNPATDQWTLNGDPRKFYKSDVTRVISYFISKSILPVDFNNEKLEGNVKTIREWINGVFNGSLYFPTSSQLLDKVNQPLEGLVDDDIDLSCLTGKDLDLAEGVIRVLSVISFLLSKTYLTVIECPTEKLAFDMFQSINSTGTPLTAIEVFKPQVVNSLGSNYGSSSIKSYFDKIESFFDEQAKASDKDELTNEVLLRMALVYSGNEIGRRFSSQRDWLINSYSGCSNHQDEEVFIRWLHDLTQYWTYVLKPRRPNTNTQNFNLVNHFVSLGLQSSDADLSALCIFYLKDANHKMAHYLISLFYSKLLQSIGNNSNVQAVIGFVEVCKACAAFFTLWSAAALKGYPDQVYRDLFSQTKYNLSILSGASNQTESFIKNNFKNALANRNVYDLFSVTSAKSLWMKSAQSKLGYGANKKVCRFSLFVTTDNSAADMNPGREGFIIRGNPGTSNYLNCKAWHASDYAEIEHIANKTLPVDPKYPVDMNLYPGNTSIVDMIGNLTLLSKTENCSMYYEWPEKVFYYSTLTALAPTSFVNLQLLATNQKISTIPPKLVQAAAGTNYKAHLAPIVVRGNAGKNWDKAFVDKRTENICSLLFDEMNSWLC